MKYILMASIVSLALSAVSKAVALDQSHYNFSDAYAATLKRSEDLGVQEENVIQNKELETQVRSNFYPSISGSVPVYRDSSSWGVDPGTSVPANVAKITGSWSLFRGLRDMKLLSQQKQLTDSQRALFNEAKRQLFIEVVSAYYSVLTFQSDKENYIQEIAANNKRVKELRDFLRIGRAQETDLLTFEANVASLEANLEGSIQQLNIAKERLSYLTGWKEPFEVSQSSEPVLAPKEISSYLNKVEDRPDFVSKALQLKADKFGVEASSAQHMPSLDLQSNYLFEKPGDPTSGGWSAYVVMSIPIFEGGLINSQVRTAQSKVRQSELILSKTKRIAELEIRQVYENLNADQQQLEKYKKSASLSEKNYQIMIKNFRRGLVTNLDVLQALTSYQASQRLFNRAQVSLQMDAMNLIAASGQVNDLMGEK